MAAHVANLRGCPYRSQSHMAGEGKRGACDEDRDLHDLFAASE